MPIDIEQIEKAKSPEEIFGPLSQTNKELLKRAFRIFSRRVHPDQHAGEQRYTDAFARLSELYDLALQVIDAPNVTIQTKQRTIVVTGTPFSSDGVVDTYACHAESYSSGGVGPVAKLPGVVKIATSPSFNDLVENEYATLRKLRIAGAGGYFAMLPEPLETFVIPDSGRRGIAYAATPGAHTLAQVHDAYPDGIDAKTMAWIWRQLLDVLGYAHSRSIIHGAVLPHHISIYAEEHRLVLTGWRAAVDLENDPDAHVPVIDETYRDWYPPEVPVRQVPTPATDIYLAAATMTYLLGVNLTSPDGLWPTGWPANVPLRTQGFLASCLLSKPSTRPQNAWKLREEFTDLIEMMWGRRKFHPFHMPARPSR